MSRCLSVAGCWYVRQKKEDVFIPGFFVANDSSLSCPVLFRSLAVTCGNVGVLGMEHDPE